MEELNFTVTTDLAAVRDMTVAANSKEVLAAVRSLVAPYKNLVVTPETRREAKNDLARLRRLRTNIDEQRKAVDRIFSGPAKLFKGECVDPILQEIDAAIGPIDAQVKEQEKAEQEEKLNGLHAYFDEKNNGVAAGFAEWDKIAARHPEWKNKGCSEDRAKSDIQMELANVERGIKALSSPAYDRYRGAMLDKFAERYDLTDAINVYTNIQLREAQDAERKKREAERARAEAEAKLMASVQATGDAGREGRADSPRYADETGRDLTQALNREFTRAGNENAGAADVDCHGPVPGPRNDGVENTAVMRKEVVFRVVADSDQAKALGGFLRGSGIEYEIIRFRNEGAEAWTVPGKRG